MVSHRTTVLNAALIAAGLVGLTLSQAHASGFALQEQSGSGLGNAYAGQAAAAEDASTIWFNPAGMTTLPGRNAVLAIHAINPEGEFNDSGSTLPPFANSNLTGEGGDIGDWSGVPAAYFSWQIQPNFWLGLGISVPFGLKTEYDEDWIGRFRATESEVKTANINPSIAWKVNEMVSLGAGVSYQKLDVELQKKVNYSGAVAQGVSASILGNPALAPFFPAIFPTAFPAAIADCEGVAADGSGCEGTVKVQGDDWSWGWNLGAMFTLSPSTRIGVGYRSSIEHELEGDVEFSNRPAALAATPRVADGDITADIELPESFTVAIFHRINPKLELMGDYTWTGWDTIDRIEVKRENGEVLDTLNLKFRNSWRAALGLNYRVNDEWKLRFGVAYDRSPVRDEFRSPRLPDESRMWLALGAQWSVTKDVALDAGYAYIISDGDPGVELTDNAESQGELRGEYDSKVHIFGAQVRVAF